MSLPNPGMDAVPFTPLTAEFLDDMIENIESLAAGTGLNTGAIGNAALATGTPVQVVSQTFSTVATGTGVIPSDNTYPQNTEGTEFMTLAITPKSSTNKLVIQVVALLAGSVATFVCGAIFQDSTANALAATVVDGRVGTNNSNSMSLNHMMTAGTTSSTTFKFRAGLAVAGTTTFNGNATAQLFNGATKSMMIITEYKA